MVTLMLQYSVREEGTFTAVFDEFEAVRRRHGATGHRRYHVDGDATRVVVLIDFPDRAAAEAFVADPDRPPALDRAGIDAAREVRTLLDLVEDRGY